MPGTTASLLVIFGASGDLAQRMLLPSLYGLQHAGLLPGPLRILGTARSELDDTAFRANVAEAVRTHVPASDLDEASLAALLERVAYQSATTSPARPRSTMASRACSTKTACSASTITSARKACRT